MDKINTFLVWALPCRKDDSDICIINAHLINAFTKLQALKKFERDYPNEIIFDV